MKHKTWERENSNNIPPRPDRKPRHVLNSTWALNLKNLHDNSPLKYKARYFLRGGLQTAGVDYFKTYASIFQWYTILLALTMIIFNSYHTKQV